MQIVKPDEKVWGKLEFGTEVRTENGSLCLLLAKQRKRHSAQNKRGKGSRALSATSMRVFFLGG